GDSQVTVPRGLSSALTIDKETPWFLIATGHNNLLLPDRVRDDFDANSGGIMRRPLGAILVHCCYQVESVRGRHRVVPRRCIMHDKKRWNARPSEHHIDCAGRMVAVENIRLKFHRF